MLSPNSKTEGKNKQRSKKSRRGKEKRKTTKRRRIHMHMHRPGSWRMKEFMRDDSIVSVPGGGYTKNEDMGWTDGWGRWSIVG
jgi:hypothetical protein